MNLHKNMKENVLGYIHKFIKKIYYYLKITTSRLTSVTLYKQLICKINIKKNSQKKNRDNFSHNLRIVDFFV